MRIVLGVIGHVSRSDIFDPLLCRYIERAHAYVEIDRQEFRSEQALFEKIRREQARTSPWTVLLDSRGREFTSEQFARHIGKLRDSGRQKAFFAIGPAGGWSPDAKDNADGLLSLGSLTLPHELAAVVLAEQIYRAFTILAGHPYHLGH